MTEAEQSKTQAHLDNLLQVWPVVQAFTTYYNLHGPEKADGLIAGLIIHKTMLDSEGQTKQ